MPKTSQRKAKASNPRKASTSKTQVKDKSADKQTPPRLYSSFLPIPLSLPSPIPIPSSSSKPLTHVTHYIYARPHKSAPSSDAGPEAEETAGRTVFVTNLPADIGERDLRTVFSRWGVIDSIEIGRNGGENVLEQAVRGNLEEEAEDDDDDEDEDEELGEGGKANMEGEDAEVGRAEPRFVGDTASRLPRSKRSRKKPQLPPSVPDIIPLPPTNPRQNPFGHSGSHTALITFLERVSVTRTMSYSGGAISIPQYGTDPSNPTGLDYYSAQHTSLRPSLSSARDFADSSMDRYDHLHSLLLSSRARARGAGALVDEDGFTVVVRGAKFGRTGGRGDGLGGLGVGVASRGFGQKAKGGVGAGDQGKGKKKGIGGSELMDFYKFQKVDRKRKELADLRVKFEQDKAKVDELKKARRFKPY